MTSRILAAGLMAGLLFVSARSSSADENPPMPGFDAARSNARAVELADRAMQVMGGRNAWDSTRVIAWTMFKRSHVWDKWTGDYRLEMDSTLVIMNINTKQGRVWEKGAEVADSGKRDDMLGRAMSIWINDSYWLLMPYKLKDTGVTLRYVGGESTENGRAADVVELTFREVGDTPENKYRVWIDRETGLVSQWAYYENASNAEPNFTRPWNKWEHYGDIMISTGRGKFDMTGVRVSKDADTSAFAAP